MTQERSVTRRSFVAVTSGAVASVWLMPTGELHAAAMHAGQAAAQTAAQDKYTVLTPGQVRELDAITSTLVPTDTTPGAKEAKVVRFIDRSLGTWAKDQKPQIEGALKTLAEYVAKQYPGTTTFSALKPADRVKALEGFEQAFGGEFNGGFWFPTMAGMFTNPSYGGNNNKVGWSLMGFKDQFSWAAPFGYYDRV